MGKPKDVPAAFPHTSGDICYELGLTKREYVATAILAGLATLPDPVELKVKFAVDVADKLLAELSKERQP